MNDGGLEAVLLANRPALLRFLQARGGVVDAEDLFQDMWVKLSTLAPSGPIAEPLAYLYKIADNMVHDRRRATIRRERRDHAWTGAVSGDDTLVTANQPSADRVLLAREELARLETLLAGLGERTAEVLRRYRIEGMSQKLIAAQLGISLSAVEKHLQRAYRALAADRIAAAGAGQDDLRRPGHENAIRAIR